MRRRFLKRFQQRVEGLLGQHVDFIDDVNLVATAGGQVAQLFAQFSYLVDAAIGCTVDLDNIQVGTLNDFAAGLAGVAGLNGGALFAVERLGQQAGHGGLADAPGAREQVGVGHAAELNRVFEGTGNVLLFNNVVKGLGPPFSRRNLVPHTGLHPYRPRPSGDSRRSCTQSRPTKEESRRPYSTQTRHSCGPRGELLTAASFRT